MRLFFVFHTPFFFTFNYNSEKILMKGGKVMTEKNTLTEQEMRGRIKEIDKIREELTKEKREYERKLDDQERRNVNEVYVVITQTGTILSRILKLITGDEYNHVSVSVDPRLETMYSFGRKNPYYPFWGGYVEESINKGTFKRFSNTDAMVLAISVNE